jgi:hypothetical protein
MGTREINAEDIGWESPLYEQAKKWLADSGIDPERIPLLSKIIVDAANITFDSIVRDENGTPVLDAAGEFILREAVKVPKKSDPESYGI